MQSASSWLTPDATTWLTAETDPVAGWQSLEISLLKYTVTNGMWPERTSSCVFFASEDRHLQCVYILYVCIYIDILAHTDVYICIYNNII